MSENKIKINRFELKNLRKHSKIGIVGKRASGKSWVIASFLKYYENKCKIVISPTNRFSEFFSSLNLYNLEIYHTCTDDLIKILLSNEKEEEIILVFDDCVSLSPSQNDLIRNNINKITLIVSAQSCKLLKDFCHFCEELDYVFCLKESVIKYQTEQWTSYFNIFPTFSSFKQVFSLLTENYGVIVSDNGSNSNILQDVVFYYKVMKNAETQQIQEEIPEEKIEEKENIKNIENVENSENLHVNDSCIGTIYNLIKSYLCL